MAASPGKKKAALPLTTLLSQTLVAFTIEFDNEFEHRSPHQTTIARKKGAVQAGPWLTSMVMWSNLMRLVPAEGITVGELCRRSRVPGPSLRGMERWGYIRVGIDPEDTRTRPPQKDWVIWPKSKGRIAQEIWRPLTGVIEERWEQRFGVDAMQRLKQSLRGLLEKIDDRLPEYLPVVGFGLFAPTFSQANHGSGDEQETIRELSLPALLSKALLKFTIDFEQEGDMSLAVYANVIRILGDEGMRIRDLARAAGVSKEGISMAVTFLKARGFAVLVPDPRAARGQLLLLTEKGVLAKEKHRNLLRSIEDRWTSSFGSVIGELRAALEPLVGDASSSSPLFAALTPYPEGWRASVPVPQTLPHYPMVLHRGGYPDGS